MDDFLAKLKAVKTGSWVRITLMILALINQFLTIIGRPPLPINNELLTEMISLIFTLIAAILNQKVPDKNTVNPNNKQHPFNIKILISIKKQDSK